MREEINRVTFAMNNEDYRCKGICYVDCKHNKNDKCSIYDKILGCENCKCIIGCNY